MRGSYEIQWAGKDLGQESKVALGDINGDGIINIVAGTAADAGNSYLHCFRYEEGKYHELARYSLGEEYTCSLHVEDIDADGRAEILLGTNKGIGIYELDGTQLVQSAFHPLQDKVISIATADYDADGTVEIAVATEGSPTVNVFKYKSQLRLAWQVGYPESVTCIASGGAKDDPHPELVVKTLVQGGCHIYTTSFEGGTRAEKWSGHIPGGGHRLLLVSDFKGRGRGEIITDISGQKIRVLGRRGENYEGLWDSPPLPAEPLDASCYDVDGDGKMELVVVGINNVDIYTWRDRGPLLEWRQTMPNGVFCAVAGRLMKEGFGEIVLGTVYGYIYVLEPRRDRHRGKLFVGRVQAIIQDTVTIPKHKPDAERGVEAQARFSIENVKVIYDKVIVEGVVSAKILYVAAFPSQPVHFFESTFSFLEFIHLCGADPGMEALVFFRTEHINVNATSPRHIKITILFEMTVKLLPGYHYPSKHKYWDKYGDCYPPGKHGYWDKYEDCYPPGDYHHWDKYGDYHDDYY